jgi:hypothetical protein
MRKNPRRILSPQRLPFRHPGRAKTTIYSFNGLVNGHRAPRNRLGNRCGTIYRTRQRFDGLMQVRLRQVRVPHCNLQGLVTHQLVDGQDVHTGHDAARGERVPEVVPREIREPRLGPRGRPPEPVYPAACELIGTRSSLPPLGFGSVSSFRSRFTSVQRRLYCPAQRSPVCNARSNSGSRSGQRACTTRRSACSSCGSSQRTRSLFSASSLTRRAGFSATFLFSTASLYAWLRATR